MYRSVTYLHDPLSSRDAVPSLSRRVYPSPSSCCMLTIIHPTHTRHGHVSRHPIPRAGYIMSHTFPAVYQNTLLTQPPYHS